MDNQKSCKQLLLLDSNSTFLWLLEDYLKRQRYKVIKAENGREALKILAQQLPDIIICDALSLEIQMGDYSFISKLRQDSRTSWIPVLFLSASSQSQERIDGLKVGADVYMLKPLVLSQKGLMNRIFLYLFNFLSSHSKKRLNKFSLSYTSPIPNTINLSFIEHVHGFNSSNCSRLLYKKTYIQELFSLFSLPLYGQRYSAV